MWKYICPLLLAFGITACHSAKESVSESATSATEYVLPDSLSTSPGFRMFWTEWNTHLKQSGKTWAEFTPTEELAKKYSLRKNSDGYILSGFLHTSPDFDKESLTLIGGNCVAYGKGIFTFHIPVREIPRLVTLPGITYIECASPAQLR